jgi:DNA-binding beta-propeller fold protein YncE
MAGSPQSDALVGPAATDTDELSDPASEEPEAKKRRRRRAFLLLFLLGLLALLLGLTIWYLLFRQPVTLPLIPESQVPGYVTSIYGVQSPTGVAVTPSGDRIYVTENGGDYGIKIFDAGGNVVGSMAFPPETGTDHVPVYVAIDPLTGEVYVSDRPTGTIHIFDRDGTWQRQYTPTSPLTGWQPLGLTFDAAGNLYVTELRGPGQRVLTLDRTGTVVREIGLDADLDFPNGIAVDKAGLVWVTDSNNGRLLAFDQTGNLMARVGRGSTAGNLGLPRGLALDASGRIFVVDSTGSGVFVYREPEEGGRVPAYVGFFGGSGVGDGQFAFPIGAAVDDRGRIYVADTANGRVQVWSY